MAKKQTRRSVSLAQKVHNATQGRAGTLKMSMSEYITGLIRADFKAAGLWFPETVHAGLEDAVGNDSDTLDVTPESIAPAVALARGRMPEMDPKVLQALEFTRRKLDESKKQPEPEQPPVDKSNECHWCGDSFKPGQIPTEHEGRKLHGKCFREMRRTGEID